MKSAKRQATPEQCRVCAETCEEQAVIADIPLIKSAMLNLAKQWRDLADERERERTAA